MLRLTEEDFAKRQEKMAKLTAHGTVRTHVCEDKYPRMAKAARTIAVAKPVSPSKWDQTPKSAELFLTQAKELNLPLPTLEWRFDLVRKWRIDAAWVEQKLAVEIDGGAFTAGRHTRGAGFVRDMEKSNSLTLAGWRLLRFTPEQVRNGNAILVIAKALK